MNARQATIRSLNVILFASAAMLLQGCAAALVAGGVAAGAGTVAYVRGDLEAISDQSVERLYKASVAALKELEITIISSDHDALAGEVVGVAADGKKVKIKIKYQEVDRTKLSIRIGTFGDQARSNYIYDHIKAQLIKIAESESDS